MKLEAAKAQEKRYLEPVDGAFNAFCCISSSFRQAKSKIFVKHYSR
jgi:hypothetical protein